MRLSGSARGASVWLPSVGTARGCVQCVRCALVLARGMLVTLIVSCLNTEMFLVAVQLDSHVLAHR